MKIFYCTVFDNVGKSSDTSKLRELEKLGHTVAAYDYRQRAQHLSHDREKRDNEIIKFCANWSPDLAIFSKCNGVDIRVFKEVKKTSPVCYWFADPLVTYENQEFYHKTQEADFFTCDKKNVLDVAAKINKNSFIVNDGFDSLLEKPKDVDQEYDVSFIGNLYGDRYEKVKNISHEVKIVNNAFNEQHSIEVSKTKINLNFCTSEGPSDRVFKVLASKGFLLTDEWKDREDFFRDGEDLVVFRDIDDLNNKIKFYLENPKERERIALNGMKTVQNYTRKKWAEKTISVFESLCFSKRHSSKKQTVLLAGPWVGEFGWELFCWHAYIRSLSKYYDRTVCIAPSHSQFLYEDFCDLFIPFTPSSGEYKDSYYRVGFTVDNKLLSTFVKEAGINTKEQAVSLITPRRIGDPPRTHYTEKFHLGPLYVSPTYKLFGSSKDGNSIVIHARNRNLRSSDNWPRQKWNILVDKLKKRGYNVISIGLKNESMHIEGTEDKRECDQQELLNILSSAKCTFGPSSGAVHLSSLCGSPQLVWSTSYNFLRYTTNWNPFAADVVFLSDHGWQPPVDYVLEEFIKWEKS